MRTLGIISLLIILCSISCKNTVRERPPLIVYISVDQMRADYLADSLYGQFMSKNGFKRMMQDGMQFKNCFHEHACTMTGPGHATLGTGAYAHKTGITGNEMRISSEPVFNYCVYDTSVYGIDDQGKGKKGDSSPLYLMISTLGEELKRQNRESKVYSISGKDRAAILMAGKNADGVFWYNSRNGNFNTSSYYAGQLPEWVVGFNQKSDSLMLRWLKSGWGYARSSHLYNEFLGPDQREGENDMKELGTTFPHPIQQNKSALTSRFYSNLRTTPFLDELTLQLAKIAIQQENLGKDEVSDLLCISLSSTDYIGHTYGPFSHEMMDQMIRLDSLLADFLDFLDTNIGEKNYVIALSADHGVAPLPEYLATRNIRAGRIDAEMVERELNRVFSLVGSSTDSAGWIAKITSNYLYLTPRGKELYRNKREELLPLLKEAARKVEGIRDLIDEQEIQNFGDQDKISRRIKHSYYQDRSGEFYLLTQPYYFFGYPGNPTGTTHGSPYDYDAHVPFILYGKNIPVQVISDSVGTADIAVTLSSLLEVARFGKNRDGINQMP